MRSTLGAAPTRHLGAFRLRQRPLASAMEALFVVYAAQLALPAAAQTCTLSGAITTSVSNSMSCGISTGVTIQPPQGVLTNTSAGTLTVTSKGVLTNLNVLVNDGTIRNAGTIQGNGIFTNNGALSVSPGGNATIDHATNLSNGVLTGGSWAVSSFVSGTTQTAASLKLNGGESITTNNAAIVLKGSQASFNSLSSLSLNRGSLSLENGATFATTAQFTNTGTVAVAAGSSVAIGKVTNLSNGVLTGGSWQVYGGAISGKETTSLSLNGGQKILTNAGDIVLSGKASFNALDGLALNQGSLTIQNGAGFATTAQFTNTGTLQIGGGSKVSLVGNVTNLQGGTLTGGTWVADATSGQAAALLFSNDTKAAPISTNRANIVLRGATATLSLSGLSRNEGSLTVEAGASFTPTTAITNTGTLRVGAGSKLNVVATNVTGSKQNGVLTGGTWEVVGSDTAAAALSVDDGRISVTGFGTNRATVLLRGATASFSQMKTLARNEGAFTVDGGASFTIGVANFSNTGTLTAGPGGTLATNQGTLANSGDLAVMAAGQVTGMGGLIQTAGTTLVDGSLTQSKIDIQGGTLMGNGVIHAEVHNSGGVVRGGTGDPGTLAITGSFSQGAGGTFLESITGRGHNLLTVDGGVFLNGTLDIELGKGFNLAAGDDFVIASFRPGSLRGTFAHIIEGDYWGDGDHLQIGNGLSLDTIYDLEAGNIRLHVSAVPEPESYAMLLAGLGVLGGVARRRRRTSP